MPLPPNFTAADLFAAAAHLPSDIVEDGYEAVFLKNIGVPTSDADEATWQTLIDLREIGDISFFGFGDDTALVVDREPLPDGVRDQAALICAIYASRGGGEWECILSTIRQDAGFSFAACRLAEAAFRKVNSDLAEIDRPYMTPSAFEIAGEAEALLRSGWGP